MSKQSSQRWGAVIGAIAVVAALFVAPTAALAAVAAPAMAADGMSDGHPCEKPCPDCPAPCSGLAACALKCFPASAPVLAANPVAHRLLSQVVRPILARPMADGLLPPLLRPPRT